MRTEQGGVMSNKELADIGIELKDEDYEQGEIEASGGRKIPYVKLKPGRNVGTYHQEEVSPKQEVIPFPKQEIRKAA